MAPVPVTKLVCDGNTYQCTANLVSNPLLMSISSFDFNTVCRAGLRRWKLGCTVEHRRLPPEPLLSPDVEPNKSSELTVCVFEM